jgi:hypothetical protein
MIYGQNVTTQERVIELFFYNQDTGVFTRRAKVSGAKGVGAVVGTSSNKGYLTVNIDGKSFKLHRIAWLYVYGSMPLLDIDHINGVRDDNRIANLREASRSDNSQNRATNKNNKSGFPGVCWDATESAWKAYIGHGGKPRFIGYYKTPELASSAYLSAKKAMHTFQPEPRELIKEAP